MATRILHYRSRRPGAVIPMVALGLVGLCGLVAFGIDLGLIMVGKTQAQNAADVAAMAAARTLDASSNGNTPTATSNAKEVAKKNKVLGTALTDTEVVVDFGAYHYDTTNKAFTPQFPPSSPDKYSIALANVTPNRASFGFASVFGVSEYKISAVSLAAHRPRDIGLVLDFSGSMNDESNLWVNDTDAGTANFNQSNNKDTVYPQWGPYNKTFSPLAALECTSSDSRVGRCNITASALGISAQVLDYYQNAFGAAGVAAFNLPAAAVTNTAPGGDTYLPVKNSTTTARTWKEIVDGNNTSATPTTYFAGYNAYYTGGQTFQGWTQGPGYWGKTFYIWPPDPATPDDAAAPPVPGDWRKRFFFLGDGTTPLNDNRKLFSATGDSLNSPVSSSYVINYKAILKWIKANCIQSSSADPKPLPPILRAGNILYYDAIPNDVPGSPTDTSATSAYKHSNKNQDVGWTDQNQRFWKEYIDYVLGVWRDPLGNFRGPLNAAIGMGQDFTPGSSTDGTAILVNGPDATLFGKTFINFRDNPRRPRHTFWFGGMTMASFIQDCGLLPGTAHDISMYSAKLGIYGALNGIKNNHPNDQVSLLLYNRPTINTAGPGGAADPAGIGCFSAAQVELTSDFAKLTNALYFPPNSSTADVRPYDANGEQTPAAGSNYTTNTATGYGLMLAYNQYSGASYATGQGGNGRSGASKIIILETDGMANVPVNANFTQNVASNGTNNSYWNLAPGNPVWKDTPAAQFGAPTYTAVGSAAYDYGGQHGLNMAARLCALTTDTTNGPGFATTNKPVLIHCLAFGYLFENVSDPPSQTGDAMSFLKKLATIGGTGFPNSISDSGNADFYKLITGDQPARQNNMAKAFKIIMDSDIPVSLIK